MPEVERLLQENPLLEKAEGEEEPPPEEVLLAGADRLVGSAPTGHDDDRADSNGGRARDAHDELRTRSTAPTSRTTSGGDDGDWGGGGIAATTTTTSIRSRSRRARCATTCRPARALTSLPLRDRQLVGALIDALDEDGYLPTPLEEIAELFPEELEIDPDELSIALCYLQSFEPAGVGARDCAECLALQLKALPAITPLRAEALKIVDGNLALLATRDFAKLKRLLHTDDAGVRCDARAGHEPESPAGRVVRQGRGELRHSGRRRTQDAGASGWRR